MADKDKFSLNIPDEKKKEIIEELILYCDKELDIEIGNLGAYSLYDHILDSLGKIIYNKAIEDAKEYYQIKHSEIEMDSIMLIK